jgi:thiamine biosynthesis lipoprotein ApbE
MGKGNYGAALAQALAVASQVQELQADGQLDPTVADLIYGWAMHLADALQLLT